LEATWEEITMEADYAELDHLLTKTTKGEINVDVEWKRFMALLDELYKKTTTSAVAEGDERFGNRSDNSSGSREA